MAWWKAARELGLEFVRLTPSRWQGTGRDFLMGNADEYRGLIPEDLERLRAQLDLADQAGIKVVLTFLSLPGCRWRQHHQDKSDSRLWRQHMYLAQAATFWRDVARELRGHPALVGYDLLNEPHPLRCLLKATKVSETTVQFWNKLICGELGDLNHFYQVLVASVRSADPDMPIILETDNFADVNGFLMLKPVADPAILYSFHWYEPWEFTTRRENNGRFAYPAKMPGPKPRQTVAWTKKDLRTRLKPLLKWTQENKIPANRILVGEFGCDRQVPGAQAYLADLVSLFNTLDWHWAFYAFREDDWPGMDYELGSGPLPAGYWEEREKGRLPELPRTNNPLFEVLRKEFRAAPPTPSKDRSL